MSDIATIHIYRTADPFARVPKAVLEDDTLSWKAKGILAYLLGKQRTWKAQVQDIVNRGTDGKSAVRSALKELRGAGYARLTRVKSGGRIATWRMDVADCRMFAANEIGEETCGVKPDPENRDLGQIPLAGIQDPENQDLENRHLNKNGTGTKNDGTKNDRVSARSEAELVYEKYPRKIGRPQALAKIRDAIKRHGFDRIFSAVKMFAACWTDAPPEEMRFCPHPSTWFNQERYNDPPVTWQRMPVNGNGHKLPQITPMRSRYGAAL